MGKKIAVSLYILDKKCPYCTGKPVFFGRKWRCSLCDARVKCHKDTDMPMGSLANKELRSYRGKIHSIIDKLWKTKQERRDLYMELSRMFNKDGQTFHVGKLDNKQAPHVYETLIKTPLKTKK